MYLWVLAILSLIGFLIYKAFIKRLSYWKDLGIPYNKDVLKELLAFFILRKLSLFDAVENAYNKFPEHRYYGSFQFNLPTLIIRDLDLIKKITVKDFDHFTDHRVLVDNKNDILFAKNLIALKGNDWRDMRSTVSPTFTSSKMKAMFYLMSNCAQQMTDYFKEIIAAEPGKKILEYEMKSVFTKYTNDVIATCAFGVEVDSMRQPENEFYKMGQDVTNIDGFRALKMFAMNLIPKKLRDFFNVSMFPPTVTNFFVNTITENIKNREQNNIVRPDLVHLLMEARKGRLRHEEQKLDEIKETGFATVEEELNHNKKVDSVKRELTDIDIAAQALIFFFAGFETASTMMCFMSHEIATNVEVQQKLQEEIYSAVKSNNGVVTYDMVAKMEYLDKIVSETLRKWPIAPAMDRECTKDYVIEPVLPGEKPFTIKKGMGLQIPTVGIHRDPELYPDPMRFDPERFNDENKLSLHDKYMPFGVGPRNCIGSRFALLEIKVLFIQILRQFNFVVVKDTTVPLKLKTNSFKLQPEKGFWLGLEIRTKD